MELFDRIILAIHVPFGFLSLILFVLPLVVKKGSKKHIQLGKLYVICMWVVIGTSFILSINNVIAGNYIIALFLGFIGVLSAKPLWYGISILKQKKGFSKKFLFLNKALTVAVFSFGVLNILFAFIGNSGGAKPLLVLFGLLGIFVGKDFMKKDVISENSNFIIEHLKGMLIAGIAAYTAFFVFGGQRFFDNVFSGNWGIVLWVSPTVIGVVIIQVFKRKYANKKQPHLRFIR